MIKLAVNGCLGRMGSEVVRAANADKNIEVVGGVDLHATGLETLGDKLNIGGLNAKIYPSLDELVKNAKPDVVVDFTVPGAVMDNLRKCISLNVTTVVGTTGITKDDINELAGLLKGKDIGCLIAPNFAIGAVLLMKFAAEAGKYFDNVEIIEYHHNRKEDYPSGTALKTAEGIALTSGKTYNQNTNDKVVKAEGARGADLSGIRIHSVRMPGFVAHEEVVFGGIGQALTLRHDSFNRESFMPGVVLSVHKYKQIKGLVYGLDKIL